MTEQEARYFQELVQDRNDSAKTLDKPSMRGVKRSVVEKYSDQAHFIYELLQNADDAGATSVRFVLRSDRLLFAHNGTRHFSVSNPMTEEEDSQNGKLGDINAITSIAQSNKTEASIGKFGVGFKAVFQYTATPEIYDPGVCFRIRRFLVPEAIPQDHPERKTGETLFVFPFDHAEQTPENAYADISDKLRGLSYPILFLSHLEKIDYRYGEAEGEYQKTPDQTLRFGDTEAQLLLLTRKAGENMESERLWLFTRTDGMGHNYSVGFFLDDKGRLKPVSKPAFCFFPTKETTNLQFIFHAPFLLTDSREGIRAGVAHNKQMVQLLAELAADSLVYLRDIGASGSVRLIDDKILDIVPTDESVFPPLDSRDKISFLPFYSAIHDKFASEELLPTIDGYTSKKNAYWAAVPRLAKLFSNAQLAQWTGEADAKWAFPSLGREEAQRKSKALVEYVDSITENWFEENDFFQGYWNTKGNWVERIQAAFIENQSIEWLHTFYQWLNDTDNRTKLSRTRPYFLNQDKKAVPAFDQEGKAILFLLTEGKNSYQTVYEKLLENKTTAEFFQKVGITEPSLKSEIYTLILPKYGNAGGRKIDEKADFRKMFRYYCHECPEVEKEIFIRKIKKYPFLLCQDANNANPGRDSAQRLYFPYKRLTDYFTGNLSVRFVLLEDYLQMVKEDEKKYLMSFLTELGVRDEVAIQTAYVRWPDYGNPKKNYHDIIPAKYYRNSFMPEIDGLEELIHLQSIQRDNSDKETLSHFLWNTLLRLIQNQQDQFSVAMKATYEYKLAKSHKWQQGNCDSHDTITLRTHPWLMDKKGEFVAPCEMLLENLSPNYDCEHKSANELIEFLQIQKQPSVQEDLENVPVFQSNDQRKTYDLGLILQKYGIEDTEEIEKFAEAFAQKKAAKNRTNAEAEEKKTTFSPAERHKR